MNSDALSFFCLFFCTPFSVCFSLCSISSYVFTFWDGKTLNKCNECHVNHSRFVALGKTLNFFGKTIPKSIKYHSPRKSCRFVVLWQRERCVILGIKLNYLYDLEHEFIVCWS